MVHQNVSRRTIIIFKEYFFLRSPVISDIFRFSATRHSQRSEFSCKISTTIQRQSFGYDIGQVSLNSGNWIHLQPKSYGGNIEWQHDRGHSASLGASSFLQFTKQTIDATGNVNLYKNNWSVDAYGQASHTVGQFNRGRTDWGAGLTLALFLLFCVQISTLYG